jgi:hypothetical protein
VAPLWGANAREIKAHFENARARQNDTLRLLKRSCPSWIWLTARSMRRWRDLLPMDNMLHDRVLKARREAMVAGARRHKEMPTAML